MKKEGKGMAAPIRQTNPKGTSQNSYWEEKRRRREKKVIDDAKGTSLFTREEK